MSARPSAKVIPLAGTARRAQGAHQAARKTAISRLDARLAQLESVVAALELRMARSAFKRSFLVALAASLLLHLAVISLVTFALPDHKTVTNPKALEVILVNAKSQTQPAKALALAQHNLDGGGNTDAERRARSPLPVLNKEPKSSDVAVARKRVEQLEREARQVMTRNKSTAAVASAPAQPVPLVQPQPDRPPSLTHADLQRSLQVQRLEAEVSRQWEAYQQRPRRQSIGASASEVRYARYVEDWRIKVMRIGESNFPQAAREGKIYGSLLLTVSIKANGTIAHIEIRRSSGSRILDDAAVRIVRLGAPYAAFPADVARDTDVIDISRTWRFTRSDQIETE